MTLSHDAYIGSNYGSHSGDRAPDTIAGPRRVLTTNSKELRTMGEFPSTRRRRARGLLAVASGGGASSASAPTGGTPITGGTATYALPPSTVPNYIFPFTSSSDFSVSNSQYFQYLMYRPLYWFGNGASPTLNSALSLATPPVYSGHNVTINLKGWKWSNGETVTADNVLFWIHMLQAVGAADWGAHGPGGFPTHVTNVKGAQ